MTYTVSIHTDRTADVSYYIVMNEDPTGEKMKTTKEMEETYESLEDTYSTGLISNFKIDTTVHPQIVSFTISEIDSLGNYISPFMDYPVSFRYTEKSLQLIGTEGQGDEKQDPTGLMSLIKLKMVFKTDQEIKAVKSKNDYISQTDRHTFSIITSIADMEFGDQKNYAKIVFKK